jgi:hypothetical protein
MGAGKYAQNERIFYCALCAHTHKKCSAHTECILIKSFFQTCIIYLTTKCYNILTIQIRYRSDLLFEI